jgi:hypothetical protein
MSARAAKETGMLFTGDMVRATLDGLKKVNADPDAWFFDRWQDGYKDGRMRAVFRDANLVNPSSLPCPYGGVGDRIWVRETWCHTGTGVWSIGDAALAHDGQVAYRATDNVICDTGFRWWPSIHMPRWACRTILEITDICVERVQDIAEAGALAEGLRKFPHKLDFAYAFEDSDRHGYGSPVGAFGALWDSLYGARGQGWSVNPWVWAVTIKRLAS